MKEVYGNMFSKAYLNFADAFCITTNGMIKKDGRCVMGAGIAKTAKELYPGIDLELGTKIKKYGNIVQVIKTLVVNDKIKPIIAFPTKHNWWERSDLKLITESLHQLTALAQRNKYEKVILPRPGCSNGNRNWLSEVKPIVEKVLFSDRYYIIHYK